jgi:AbrB family looped-hinge helix DNA binding protein
MTIKVSTKGGVMLPASLRRKLSLRAGDSLDVKLEDDVQGARIVMAPRRKKQGGWRIITDPVTGWPALKGPPGTPKLTTERVKELLADFP